EVNGEAIRTKRMAAGIEMKDLAERSGNSHRYLSHLETGSRRRRSPTRYVALRTALHATDEELLSTEEPH
ncbi:helix-turn-helix transcriptional regulator, partial [Streptomyces sp. A73]|nr:helix-turn-helix transcriptional regulator [Streptomyces sp. A73]